MTFKNHGPGGCCCGTCPLWQDQFDLNGWNVDDDGKLSWELFGSSQINFYEQSSALITSNSGGFSGGPSLRFNQPDSGIDWAIDYGYKAQITLNVDYGHAVVGDSYTGLMFDVDTAKAYPIRGSAIYGSGFDFDPSYPFDMTLTKTAGPTEKFSPLGRMTFCQVNATDRVGNEIDYRFMAEDRGTLTLGCYKEIGSRPNTQVPTPNDDVYIAVDPPTPSYTDPPCQFRVHDITMEGISNLQRIPPFWDGPQPVIRDREFSEIQGCDFVPEWNIDGWINPYDLTSSGGAPAFSPSAKIKVTSSAGPAPVNRTDNFIGLRYINNYGGGYYEDVKPGTAVNIPSNMVIWSGVHTYRFVFFTPPNIIQIVDRFDMATIGTGDDCFIAYYFDIGEDGNREFPFVLDGATPFLAVAWVSVERFQTPRIDPIDVWNTYGSLEWLIEKL